MDFLSYSLCRQSGLTSPIAVIDGSENRDEQEYKFASQAKQALWERQKEAEEAERKKARPGIIDIWGEQCVDSGVFENTPAARSADVVAGYESEEEEEEEGEEEGEEEES